MSEPDDSVPERVDAEELRRLLFEKMAEVHRLQRALVDTRFRLQLNRGVFGPWSCEGEDLEDD